MPRLQSTSSRRSSGRSRHRSARVVSALAATGLALAALTACGSSETDGAAGGDVVEINHKFGTTKIPEAAKRVVTVGWNDQDFVLSLGVVPVTTRAWFDNYSDLPWVQKATGGKGVEALGGDGINFEAVAKAKPDVIFGIYESIDKKTYQRLSQIAPTVIQSDDYPDEETPWDVQLLTTGKALGKEAEAQALLDQVNAKVDDAKKANPGFAGKVLVQDFGPEDGGHFLVGKGDPRRTVFDALGFETQEVTGDVSEEKLSELDRDVLFVVGATKQDMIKATAFGRLDVVKDDRALYTTFDSPLGGALSYSGPEALMYALDTLVPQLANAVNGKPVADLSNS